MRLVLYSWWLIGLTCVCLSAVAQQGELKEGYYADGTLRYRGYFVGKQPVGEMLQYYPSGQLKAKLNYRGRKRMP